MRYMYRSIVFQELPDCVSLSYTITGCDMKCNGCHSSETWNSENGEILNIHKFNEDLDKYNGLIDAVLFFGGEWHEEELIHFLSIAKSKKLKTCLYTGLELDQVSNGIIKQLDYIKTGKWDKNLGGLENKFTNQKLINLGTGENLNYKFTK